MKTGELVMIRLNNDPSYTGRQRHYNTWFTVMFIDNDGSFIGRCTRVDPDFTLYQFNQDVKLSQDKVQHTYQQGEQFCYSDKITICKCKGLCDNK